jgi:hypothetical protein
LNFYKIEKSNFILLIILLHEKSTIFKSLWDNQKTKSDKKSQKYKSAHQMRPDINAFVVTSKERLDGCATSVVVYAIASKDELVVLLEFGCLFFAADKCFASLFESLLGE